MTTLQRLLSKSAVLLAVAFSFGALAKTEYCPKSFEVLERDQKGSGYSFKKMKLEKLFCTNSFEGEHFKIVYATEEEAIAFDNPNQALIKKAANVYHHLTIARNFWMETIKSKYVASLPQITIRIDITNAFSNLSHYKHAEQEKNYNNAWSIPGGKTPRNAPEQLNWGQEIWFSPMKKVEATKHVKSEGNNPVHESLLVVKEPIVDYNTNALIYTGLGLMVVPSINNSSLLTETLQRVGTIAVIYGLVQATKYMDKWFMDKYFYIDTAMVPEIIYHEFAHIAMSDTMKTVHSVPVIEGMADYFAARIADRRQMYEKMKEISTNKSKDLLNRDTYHPYLEAEWNATSDFTVSLLWQGRVAFDKLNSERVKKGQEPIANYDEIIFQTHFELDESANIMTDLTKALLKTCSKLCKNKRAGMNTFHSVFEQKGLN